MEISPGTSDYLFAIIIAILVAANGFLWAENKQLIERNKILENALEENAEVMSLMEHDIKKLNGGRPYGGYQGLRMWYDHLNQLRECVDNE